MSLPDQNLIALYAEDTRIRLNDLSKKLHKSPQRIRYTLKQLSPLFQLPHCIFDYSYFGLILFRVYFKCGYINQQDKEKILQQLNNNQYIVAMYELSGEYDLVFELIAPNPSRVNKELKKLSSIIPSLNHYKLVLNIVSHLYPRTYLLLNPALAKEWEKQIIIGGDRQQENFTQKELLIMQHLLNNPQTRLSSLAQLSGLHIKTTTHLLKSLHKRRIIRSYKCVLNNPALHIEKIRLFLKLHNLQQYREEELMEFLRATPEIILLNKTVGDWEIEVDLECQDKTRIKFLISQIREQFKDIIANFNRAEFEGYYKRSYLPQYVFNPDLKPLYSKEHK